MLTQAMITRQVHYKHIPLIDHEFDILEQIGGLEAVLQNTEAATMCHNAVGKKE